MDRAPEKRHAPGRVLSILAILGLVAGMLALSSTADAATCLAKDKAKSSSNLQSIIDGASTGDTIVIKGTCVGNFLIPGAGAATSLTLMAKKKATLNGNHSGQVVNVGNNETVTFKNLLITNGHFGDYGGGIYNYMGTLHLTGTTHVNGNTGYRGGGIYNDEGTVILSGKAHVNGNTATPEGGGGIYSYEGTVDLSGKAQVDGNTASTSGGGIYNDGATLVGAVAGVNVKSNHPDNIAP